MVTETSEAKYDVWFVYDGECPICRNAASALKIAKVVGQLRLLDARQESDHTLMQEINAKQMNLDDGMVIKFQDSYYHAADALHIMALLGSGHGWFNRMNALIFRSKTLSKLIYPCMRALRNFVIKLKGVSKINNLGN